jgi:hypothetical protein
MSVTTGRANFNRAIGELLATPTINTNTLILNVDSGSAFSVAINQNINTFTITGSIAGTTGITLITTGNGTAYAITWPGSVKWAGGTAPTYTSTNGKQDIYSFVTVTTGASWFGFVGGQDY